MLPVGFGVRPLGWFGQEEQEIAVPNENPQQAGVPAVEDTGAEDQLNNEAMARHGQPNQRRRARVETSGSESDASNVSTSSSDTSESSSSSGGKRRKSKRSRKERRKRHQGRRKRKCRERSSSVEHGQPQSVVRQAAVDVSKGWLMPEFPDKLPYDELRLEWPTWKSMLLGYLRMKERGPGQLSEEDKLTLLITRGGKTVREIEAYQPPVEDEETAAEGGEEPKFANLLKRCDFYFKARDPTTEITVLRGMRQKKEESVRDFLAKARKQIRLCGYRSIDEQERELVMLLKTNCIDADEISKQSMGRTAAELEALAVGLEELRRRGSLTMKVEEKKAEDTTVAAIVKAVTSKMFQNTGSQSNRGGDGVGSWPKSGGGGGPSYSSDRSHAGDQGWQRGNRNQQRGRQSQQGAGRSQQRGGQRQGDRCFDCGSSSHWRGNCPHGPSCYTCGSKNHMKANCPRKGQGGDNRYSRVNQLESQRDELENEKVKDEGWNF